MLLLLRLIQCLTGAVAVAGSYAVVVIRVLPNRLHLPHSGTCNTIARTASQTHNHIMSDTLHVCGGGFKARMFCSVM